MRFLSILMLFLLSFRIPGQFTVSKRVHKFEMDTKLINGKKYSYFPGGNILGHQFLDSEKFSLGTVTIQGKTYSGVSLNLDIYNQQL